MSLVDKRQAIADALSELTDVRGFPYAPSAPRASNAWPLLGPIERDRSSGQFMVTWRVLVVLPQNEEQASSWIDTHLDLLWEALQPQGYIDSFEPVVIATNNTGADLRALQITMRSE